MTTGAVSCAAISSSGTFSSSTSVTSSGTMSCSSNAMTCGVLSCNGIGCNVWRDISLPRYYIRAYMNSDQKFTDNTITAVVLDRHQYFYLPGLPDQLYAGVDRQWTSQKQGWA